MRLRALTALAAIAVAGSAAVAANAYSAVFPPVTGQNLNGRTFHLPGDFQAPASFVYIAFVRGQQAQVDSWKSAIADARRRFPAIGEYEVPTLSKSNALFRGFIDGGMRSGIRDDATRNVTITLYIDKRPFDASLGIGSEDEIAVLLVKPDGTVLWRASGAYAPAKRAGLDEALAAVAG